MMPTRLMIILCAALCFAGPAYSSTSLEWDRIANWTGEGENTAAIGIQFNDGTADCIYVYGYKWHGDIAPDIREVMTSICHNNNSLCILEQQVSKSADSYRLAGIGFGMDNAALHGLWFDFEAACRDSSIGFDYYARDSSGILIGPGDATAELCAGAIAAAVNGGHVVEHPINVAVYGAASYDYDHWKVSGINSDIHWNAGWNIGNWVMWSGISEVTAMTYAGMGYASRKVRPGEFIVWNFNRHDNYPIARDPVDGYSGASRPARYLKYVPGSESNITDIPSRNIPDHSLFTLNGIRVTKVERPGFYVMKSNGKGSSRIIFFNHTVSTSK